MHKVTLPTLWHRAVQSRRAHRVGPDQWDPATTALLVIDMQKAFVGENAPLEVRHARSICANINQLAASLRQCGGQVIWVTSTLPAAGDARDWIYLTDFLPPDRREIVRSALQEGSEWHDLWPELEVEEGDPRCVKDRFSPFARGASNIGRLLREHEIRNLLLAGTETNVCVETTARDAMMLNFRVGIVEDACAARNDADHMRGLMTVGELFADLITTGEMVAALAAAKKAAE